MFRDVEMNSLVKPTLRWFQENQRDLPWRHTKDPYHIWVSEIMLQQTRVEAVIPYYQRFLRELPTIADLAACPEDRLLKLWEGLGYYSRVRNMQKAALVIMEHYDGRMPESGREIQALPGIGAYTAGAIASRVYGELLPAVDGNVLRVLTRLSEDDSDIAKERTKKDAIAWMTDVMQGGVSSEEAGAFNQALMELGATVCVPNGEPRCMECPWQEACGAYAHGTIDVYPVKAKAKARRIEEKTILLLQDDNRVVLRKRPSRGLLAGLYEFPWLEGYVSRKECVAFVRSLGAEPLHVEALPEAKHIFSHVEWRMKGYLVKLADAGAGCLNGGLLVPKDEIQRDYPIPAAFEKYARIVQLGIGAEEVRKQMDL
ncbi:MAG: A/G-specific adenine glycosylase [Lachnospiraceae bacterium]|nr:A/G-specific adenine glycosylase [Lachnospiraceae bacterium]